MSQKMLIDAGHPEETRVVVLDGGRVEEFDYESQARRQLRGNIYLARVTRVEPSLQAAFVEYGGNRHGFLAFNEIHPDYYQIPLADRQALIEEERAFQSKAARAETGEDGDESASSNGGEADDEDASSDGGRPRGRLMRRYKIQEVIKRRQILLVQAVKEERGNKGAALTTYISLAGRYGVLMPNTARGGGISRKITSATDRKRLRSIVDEFELPDGMGLIVRTAGAKRTKSEVKRDYEYLMKLWEQIRDRTLKSVAPCLIHEEDNLVKRAIRDLYDKDIESVLVEGDDAYREAKDFIRMLMPSHAKKVQPYKGEEPLYLKHKVEDQLEQIYDPTVTLKSGGYLVINQTEALVAIDVNSGRSTRERNIEATALKTNLEAAEEACRQFRLRDLAGLLVIDFIDMEEAKNNRAVEKRIRDGLKRDRARVQSSKISSFGLMELSRQRRRANLLDGSHETCATCKGRGIVRSVESSALHVLHRIEDEGVRGASASIRVTTATGVALYLLNEKRPHLNAAQARYNMHVMVTADPKLVPPDCEIEVLESRRPSDAPKLAEPAVIEDEPEDFVEPDDIDEPEEVDEPATSEAEPEDSDEGGRKKRRRRRRRRPADAAASTTSAVEPAEPAYEAGDADAEEDASAEAADADGAPVESAGGEEDKPKRRRRRGRRGGRSRRAGAERPADEPEGMRVVDPESETAPEPEPPESEDPGELADAEEADAPAPAKARPAAKRAPRARRAPARKPAPEPDENVAEGADEAGETAVLEPVETASQPAESELEMEGAMPSQLEPPDTDPDAQARRQRWQDRLKTWLNS